MKENEEYHRILRLEDSITGGVLMRAVVHSEKEGQEQYVKMNNYADEINKPASVMAYLIAP